MAFQWNPDIDQTYSDDVDLPLPGAPATFNKAAGKSFTMAAANHTLTLAVTSTQDAYTTWGTGQSQPQTTIDVTAGTLKYEVQPSTRKAVGLRLADGTLLRATNNGNFTFAGNRIGKFGTMGVDLFISARDDGVIAIDSVACDLGVDVPRLGSVNINVAERARMTVQSDSITMANANVGIQSHPADDQRSLTLTAPAGVANTLSLVNAEFSFIGTSTGLFSSPSLVMQQTNRGVVVIDVADSAKLDVKFDTASFVGSSCFSLGAGGPSATIRIDGYTPGVQPFDFQNKQYPLGLFELSSRAGGAFVIYLPGNAFDKQAMLNAGLIAIDAKPQTNDDRLSFTYDTGGRKGYTTIRLKP